MLIEEIKLRFRSKKITINLFRMIISQDFPMLNQSALNLIFRQMGISLFFVITFLLNLANNVNPIFGGQRKIYFPEFMSLLKKSTIMTQKIKNEKINIEASKKKINNISENNKNEKTISLNREKNGFVKNPFSIANKNANYDDSIRIFFEKMDSENNKNEKIGIKQVFLKLTNQCKEKDLLGEGTYLKNNFLFLGNIRADYFKKILEENLSLSPQDQYVILNMAENIAGVIKKNAYGYQTEEKFISYQYFFMQLEKFYLIKQIF